MAVMTRKKKKKGKKVKKQYSLNVERQTICVPLKLKKRMRRFQDQYNVNWSEIASKAFRRYMREQVEGENVD